MLFAQKKIERSKCIGCVVLISGKMIPLPMVMLLRAAACYCYSFDSVGLQCVLFDFLIIFKFSAAVVFNKLTTTLDSCWGVS